MLDRTEPIRRIVITGDVLRPRADRPGDPASQANVQWLYRLLAWPLSLVTDLPVSCVSWGDGFDTAAFYRAVDLAPDIAGWARVHYADDLPAAADALIESSFRDALVIGCETTPCVAAGLTRLGIPLLDTIGHPIRFLDDLLNAWRSNHAGMAGALTDFRYDVEFARAQAGLISAKMAWRPSLDVPADSALLIGQVGSDKALIHRSQGRLLGFGDFIESLFDIAERHSRVLYKPHPYEDRFGNSAAVVKRFKSFQHVSSNYYWLASQPQIGAVYAISSGTCAEAPFFGKTGNCFHEPLYRMDGGNPDERFGLSSPVPVEHEWLWPRFWNAVLGATTPVSGRNLCEPRYRANRIRRSLNADWNFGEVDAVVSRDLP